MQKLNESPVTPDQIDSLGHLNVRYYIARMDLANRQLMKANGVSGDEHTFLRRVDTFNKFRREQFNGAVLGTYGVLIGEGVICLLYTSPSPRDRQKSRMPSSA